MHVIKTNYYSKMTLSLNACHLVQAKRSTFSLTASIAALSAAWDCSHTMLPEAIRSASCRAPATSQWQRCRTRLMTITMIARQHACLPWEALTSSLTESVNSARNPAFTKTKPPSTPFRTMFVRLPIAQHVHISSGRTAPTILAWHPAIPHTNMIWVVYVSPHASMSPGSSYRQMKQAVYPLAM